MFGNFARTPYILITMGEAKTVKQSDVLLKVKPGSFSVSIDLKSIFSFDLEGRLIGGYKDGINYKRGFDNSILRKWSVRTNEIRRRQRRKLTNQERREFLEDMSAALRDIYENPHRYHLTIPDEETRAWGLLERCLNHDFPTLEKDAAEFSAIYKPVTILPPDQYYSLVLQVTEGCSYNKCTFCSFYRDRHFRIKSIEELSDHITRVKSFFGRSLDLRQSLFLADANALIMPQRRLLDMLSVINKEFSIKSSRHSVEKDEGHRKAFRGIYSFIDLFTGEYKSAGEFREMADLGVARAYIGMESGSKPLLEFLNKPGSKPELISAVNKVKAGGVNVGVILLLGAGGRQYSATHVTDTADALNQMDLDENDFIYFSDFLPQAGTPYNSVAISHNITPLSYQEMRHQEKEIRKRLHYDGGAQSPKITRYDIREFLY